MPRPKEEIDLPIMMFTGEGYTQLEVWRARNKAIPEYIERTKRIRVYNQKEYTKIFIDLMRYHLDNPEEV